MSGRMRGVARLGLILAGLMTASSAQAEFSPNGQFYAGPTGPLFTVADYRGWPGAAPVLRTIAAPKPMTYKDFRLWRIDNEGFLWIADGLTLTRYSSDPAVPPQTRTIKLTLPAGAKLTLTTMGQGKTPSIIHVIVNPRNDVQEVRCKLDPQIFAEISLADLCKSKIVLNLDKTKDADYITVDTFGYTDYRISAGTTYYREVSRGPVTYDYKVRSQVLDGEVVFENAKTLEEFTHPPFKWLFREAAGQYYIDDTGRFLHQSAYGSNAPIELTGSDAIISYDGRYAFTRPAGKPSSYLVRDLSKPAGTEREVLMSSTFDLTLSPNGRFFLAGGMAEPLPMAYLLDPYFGKSKAVVEDVLMAKIVGMMGQQRWADALPIFADLEARSSDLPEDFYFYQADAMARAGQKAEAQKKADAFIAKYGRKSPNYARMIEILAQ